MGSGDERRLREVALEVTSQAGFDLEELVVRSAGRRRVVRVVIDGDGGVTLDAAADISRAISERLDAIGDDDPAGTLPYTLEVTSPGIGRPLTLPRHFRRARTRLVALVTSDGRTVTGHVLAAGEDAVTLVLNGRKGLSEVEVAYADIDRAKVEVEFSSPPVVLAKLGIEPASEPSSADEADDDEVDDDEADDDEADEDELDGDELVEAASGHQTDDESSTELDDANEGMNR
jgi:ribosome maturation factor RimP